MRKFKKEMYMLLDTTTGNPMQTRAGVKTYKTLENAQRQLYISPRFYKDCVIVQVFYSEVL